MLTGCREVFPSDREGTGPGPGFFWIAESDIWIGISDLKIRDNLDLNIRYHLVPPNATIRLA